MDKWADYGIKVNCQLYPVVTTLSTGEEPEITRVEISRCSYSFKRRLGGVNVGALAHTHTVAHTHTHTCIHVKFKGCFQIVGFKAWLLPLVKLVSSQQISLLVEV